MIRVEELTKTYDRSRRRATEVLRGVSFTLPDTGFVCVVGASGCGKTSLLNAVGGLDEFDGGSITSGSVRATRYGSRDMERERNNSFGYIFQNYYLLADHSVAYNVYLGLHALKLTHREKLARVREALASVNMERYARRVAGELSGGQQQRVAIARALARRPRVIFADEPTGNLDEENTLNICTLLRRISRTSLVVMVTHEENIARFFADRIITLSQGQVASDSESWSREGVSPGEGSALYTGDYAESRCEEDGLRLRVLREPDAPPAELTVVVLRDRVLIKMADARTVSCSRPEEEPPLREGERPVLTLEQMEDAPAQTPVSPPAPPARAGSGLSFPMMVREAVTLLRGKGLRRLGTWLFLAVMAVLTTLMVGDYLTVSSLDPEDFITSDSHILEIQVARGPDMPAGVARGALEYLPQYMEYLEQSGLDFDLIPQVNSSLRYTTQTFPQLGTLSEAFPAHSYAPVSRLDESTLLYGRMPRSADEIVVDRWVLDSFLAQDGVLQKGIPGVDYFLNATLQFNKKNYAPIIVGICDSAEPTVYLTAAGLVSAGLLGTELLPLSQLREMYPGEYDGVTLGENECMVNPTTAGIAYSHRVGSIFVAASGRQLTIVAAPELDSYASIIVDDGAVPGLLRSMTQNTDSFRIYCADKGAMLDYLAQGSPLDGILQVSVDDAHGRAWAQYQRESHLKADARTIVTFTVIALSMVMLYLLQRAWVQERIGMMAVYRLLGIPRRKLQGIFAMESVLLCLLSALPATLLTWAVVGILTALPSLDFALLLPWQAALGVFLGILVYDLLVSLLPARGLLRLPPAQLAGKYDL